MRWAVIALAFSLSAPVSWGQTVAQGFVVDASKPFVFVEFDHIGMRKPLSPSESQQGLWLRVVNNCRIPIRVDTFDLGTGDPGMAIFDEVVPVKPYAGYITSSGEIHSGVPINVPQGYVLLNKSVIHKVIPPRESLLFSVPANHVQAEWHIQFSFQFDLPERATGQQEPISLLKFYWVDIPARYREATTPGPR